MQERLRNPLQKTTGTTLSTFYFLLRLLATTWSPSSIQWSPNTRIAVHSCFRPWFPLFQGHLFSLEVLSLEDYLFSVYRDQSRDMRLDVSLAINRDHKIENTGMILYGINRIPPFLPRIPTLLLSLKRSFYPTTPLHPVSSLIRYPREIR